MQYVLTEEEYKKLKNAPEKVKEAYTETIKFLCTEVATHKPVKVDWREGVLL